MPPKDDGSILTLTATIGKNEISKVQIKNMNHKHGLYDVYKILKPEIKYNIILHKKSRGWSTLAAIAFHRISLGKKRSNT